MSADIVRKAFDKYSENKHKRKNVRRYESCLDENLDLVLRQLVDESWTPSPYIEKTIFEKKMRRLAKAPIRDHVLEAAAIFPYEKQLYDYIAWQAPAVRPGLGQSAMLQHLRNLLFGHSQEDMAYNLSMDAHHFFPLMDHDILKRQISRKVKDGKLQRVLYKVVDSYSLGAPLGIKVSQIFGMLYLADFDRLAMRFFDIGNDTEKLHYWTSKYIEGRIATAKTVEDYRDLCRGPQYLAGLFRRYVEEGLPNYIRFVDNIIFIHPDKTVLGIVKIIATATLASKYHVTINKDYNVRPTYMGIRICGYVFYHDRVLLAIRNKHVLASHVARLKKKNISEEEIRIRQASRFGYAKHVNCINLIKKIGMENSLGKIIRRRKIRPPFEGMGPEQKEAFSRICSMLAEPCGGGNIFDTWNKKILLTDYVIEDSKIDKKQVTVAVPDSMGHMQNVVKMVPEKALAIRYKKILRTEEVTDADGNVIEKYVFEKQKDKNGQPTLIDAEFYAFTGSKILISQAEQDFSHEGLPCPTIIRQLKGKGGQTFFKFT